jgi:hypothetical protein
MSKIKIDTIADPNVANTSQNKLKVFRNNFISF